MSPNLEAGATRRVGSSEHFVGLEVSLAQMLADRLEVGLEIHTLTEPGYAPLIPAMLEGTADLVASTLSITPERKQIVDFSKPYDFAYQVVVVRQGSEIRSAEDLGDKVAVTTRGSSHQQHLQRLGIEEHNMRFVDFVEAYYPLLAEGGADFAVVDSFQPDRLDEFQNAQATDGLEVAFALPEVDRIAAALPQGSDLKHPLDELIEELEASGELEQMRREARAIRAELM
ncbi:MAG: transporter substrate-binding domain-containing protein [Acidobacteriota bacterium]